MKLKKSDFARGSKKEKAYFSFAGTAAYTWYASLSPGDPICFQKWRKARPAEVDASSATWLPEGGDVLLLSSEPGNGNAEMTTTSGTVIWIRRISGIRRCNRCCRM